MVRLQKEKQGIDTYSNLFAQVIVVVTHGWHVLCFDHNLQLLWDRSIKVTRQPERQRFQQFVRLHEQITLRAVPANGHCIRLAEASQLRRRFGRHGPDVQRCAQPVQGPLPTASASM